MINSKLGHVKTLEEFNSSIIEQQEEAHGEYYCAIHDAIKKYMKDCKSYMELGVHQGGTASTGILCNPKNVCLIDNDMSRYNNFLKPIAEKYCKKNNITLDVRQTDSTGFGSVSYTDMLVIDSYHHPRHMNRELAVHGMNVKKYIIAHDTSVLHGKENPALYNVLHEYCEGYQFKVIKRETRNVGYTVLKRV